MNKTRIDSNQLFSLIILFVFGTSIGVNYGLEAKKDAWMTILLGTANGCGLFLIYSYFYRQFPDLSLIRYVQKIVGKFFGWPFGLIIVLYFIYDAARDVRDAGEMLFISIYNETPVFILNAAMLFSVAYVLYKGVEVLARISEIFAAIIIVSVIAGSILVFLSGIVDIRNLLPVLENGWKPIVTTVYPNTFVVPFGEMFCFCMLFPHLKEPRKQMRTGLFAIVIGGFILSYIIALDIAVLGTDIAGRSTFALLTMISKVDIADFLQRLDPLVLFILIIVVFFKVSLLFYAAVIGAAELFNVQSHRQLVFPIGIVVLLTSIFIASSFNEHLTEGKLGIANFHAMVTVGIPVLLVLILLIRKQFNKRKSV